MRRIIREAKRPGGIWFQFFCLREKLQILQTVDISKKRLTNEPVFGIIIFAGLRGEMAEWLKALVLKTSDAERHRGFESLSLRQPSSLEKYPRGRRGSPAKGVGWDNCREGSNPSFSAKSSHLQDVGFFFSTRLRSWSILAETWPVSGPLCARGPDRWPARQLPRRSSRGKIISPHFVAVY